MTAIPGTLTESKVYVLVRKWKLRLGLQQWRIPVVFRAETEADEDFVAGTLMSVNRSDFYDDAVLYLHPSCVGQMPFPQSMEKDMVEALGADKFAQYLERKIVHELLHLVIRDLSEVAFGGMEERIGRDAFNLFEASWKRAEEKTVDSLAESIVSAWPS